MEEQSELRNVPQINKNYQSKTDKDWVPIHERIPPTKDFDNVLLKRRQGKPQDNDGHDDTECTFQPNFVSNNRGKSRSVDDLLKWGDDKMFKLANMRLGKLKGTEHTFKPDIDKNSKKMAGKRKGNVEDRLMEAGKNVAAKRDKKLELYQKRMFRPRINLNSKQILNKMNDELYKKDNGQTENLDFWEAVPIPTWNTKLTLGKSKQDKGTPEKPVFDSRSRFVGKDLKEAKEAEAQAKTLRLKKSQRKLRKGKGSKSKSAKGGPGSLSPSKKKAAMDGKTVQFLDDYVSPYNKSMLASGLPLKTILKKSKKMNKMGKRNKGNKKSGRNKNRSMSGRRRSMSDLNGTRGRFGRSRSKSISYSGKEASKFRNALSNQKYSSKSRSRSGSRRKGNLASTKKFRSHSHSERRMAPYCQKFDPNEFARSRRERLFDHKQWNEEIRKRNEENSYNNVKKLIYSDLYDAKQQRRSRNYSVDSDDKALKKSFSRSRSKSKRTAHLNMYHPLNQDKKIRERTAVGNDYMYRSIEKNKAKIEAGGYDTELDYGMRNVFNNIMLH